MGEIIIPRFRPVILQQDSDEWHNWRARGIGASDYYQLDALENDKTGLLALQKRLEKARIAQPVAAPAYITKAAQRGKKLEPIARQIFNETWQHNFQPLCVESIQDNRVRCSLDGYNHQLRATLEIKCLTDKQHIASIASINTKYRRQIEYQLWVTGAEHGIYFGYHPEMEQVIRVISPAEETEARILKLFSLLKWEFNTSPVFIFLFGCARSGKTSIAQALANRYGYKMINFADELKRICVTRGILSENFTEEEKIAKRNEIIDIARQIREKDPLYFNNALLKSWESANYPRVVCSDGRFLHEYLLAMEINKRLSAKCFYIERQAATPSSQELITTVHLKNLMPVCRNDDELDLAVKFIAEKCNLSF